MKTIFCLLFHLLIAFNFYAQTPSNTKENLLKSALTYKTEKTISVETLDSLILSKNVHLVKSKITHPTSNNYIWLKFSVNWLKNDAERIIELDNPHINDVALYEKQIDNTYKKIGFGGDKSYVFSKRSYINRRYIFPLKNTTRQTDYYLMLDNRKSLMVAPLWIWNKHTFKHIERRQNFFYIIYFSFVFFIGIIAILLGLFNRQKLFIHYGLYIFSLWLYLFTTLGFSFQYLYPNQISITNDTRYLTITILILTSINFMISFLKMKIYTNNTVKIFRALQYIFILMIGVYLYDVNIFYKRHIALTYFFRCIYIVIITGVLRAVYIIYKKERKRALLFIASFSFVILGLLAYIALQLGVIHHSWFSINPVIIGVGIEVFVLSIAMFYILKKILQRNIVLQNEKDHLISELTELNKILKNKQEAVTKEKVILKNKILLNSANILYIKSDGHYVEYYLNNQPKPETERNSLTQVLKNLPENSFVRIHKSYIVNLDRIRIINSTEIMIDDGTWINLSRTYKNQLKELLHKNKETT